MLRNLNALFMTLLLVCLGAGVWAQGVTTASVLGSVTSEGGEALIGATVIAKHEPSGATYGTTTRIDGRYNLPNLRVGGPYTITVSYTGFEPKAESGIFLALGQSLQQNFKLAEKSIAVTELVVTANRFENPYKSGSQFAIDQRAVADMPTLNRNLADYARLTPEASLNRDDAISFAGHNNRFNAIFIDGAVNNDVFGLAGSGTNGGQTGISPISGDVIEQFQVSVAPYDVRLGGFAGGALNAVTRSGSNNVEGSAYYLFRNENLAGKNVWATDPQKLAPFTASITGLRVGGPIIKDKLFFFVNAEIQREETPQPFDFEDYNGNITEAQLETLANRLRTEYDYDPGGYLNNTRTTNSDKIFARFDWNINQNHKLMLRHSYTKGEATIPNRSSAIRINFFNNGQFFPSVTNSTALELTSTFSSKYSNKLIAGYTRVRDDRDPMGGDFPYVIIRDGSNFVEFGSEQFSTANQLDQDIFTLTDNFTIFAGDHELTIGTHNEFYNIYNLFVRQSYGVYTYDSLNQFLNGLPVSNYTRSFSLVDNKVADGSAAAADFNAMQLGFYIQDEWRISKKFRLQAGIRADIAALLDDPRVDTSFNNKTLALFNNRGIDLGGARSGASPKTQLLWSPRLGFNYDVLGNGKTTLRGGVGIFTSRIPFVWPGGMFTNNGVTVGGINRNNPGPNITFRDDINNQYSAADVGATVRIPSGQVDLFTEDFKYPQMLKTSLAIDQKLPWGIEMTLEGTFSKTLNNLAVRNVNSLPLVRRLNNGPDNRFIYSPDTVVDRTYTGVFLNENTNEGYTYTLTALFQKRFSKGFYGALSYTYGEAKAINDGTSSQNSSNWAFMENVNGRNFLDLSYSDFDLGHKVTGLLSYSVDYLKFGRTALSVFINAQSGQRYSYVYGNGGNMTRESGTSLASNFSDLIWVPASRDQINLVDIKDAQGNVTLSADQQWADLDAFINDDPYLKDQRGQYAERNGARAPFTAVADIKLTQDFYIKAGGKKHTLQLTFDIFNFSNLLNKNWGRRYFLTNDQFSLIRFERFDTGTTRPQFTFRKPTDEVWQEDDAGLNSSRWQGQIGIRYIFN